MERNQPPIPQKSNSFSSSSSSTANTDKFRLRNLSLNNIQFIEKSKDQDTDTEKPEKIDEGEEGEQNKNDNHEDQQEETPQAEENIASLIENIDHFLAVLLSFDDREDKENVDDLPEIPESTIDKFVGLVEKEIAKYESGEEKFSPEFLETIDRVSKLTTALSSSSSNPKYFDSMNLTGIVLHHAMTYLEDELYSLLEEYSGSSKDQGSVSGGGKNKRQQDHDRSPAAEASPPDYYPSSEALGTMHTIANAMISSGYDMECHQVFWCARRNAFKYTLSNLGFEKIAIDDVQRMAWDALEVEIAKWSKTFRQAVSESLPLERNLCYSVFHTHQPIAADLLYHLAHNTIHNLLNFPEAVAMTKRSMEKLFKVLDMYEALKDMIPKIDLLFTLEAKEEEKEEEEEEEKSEESPTSSSPAAAELKSEMSAAKGRLGESAFSIFCELENSIKSDVGKNAVPGGAVHPLTRYVMNYLKYACEYIDSLQQIFKDHRKSDDQESSNDDNNGGGASSSDNHTPFEAQLIQIMDLLLSNLESKAKLYKEGALNHIFLMNNGRYIVQKIKGSSEINSLLGNTWCRKRSSDLRQYHKNYQRETWSKVLACFKDEGLTIKGSVSKPVLKERFKSFNALFEEIHKSQSCWVVSDEQLQSELRVSISAVVVPAYRSFLGRYSQVFDAGRQTEKYIKFAAEDLETAIDELFDGNPSSMVRRRT